MLLAYTINHARANIICLMPVLLSSAVFHSKSTSYLVLHVAGLTMWRGRCTSVHWFRGYSLAIKKLWPQRSLHRGRSSRPPSIQVRQWLDHTLESHRLTKSCAFVRNFLGSLEQTNEQTSFFPFNYRCRSLSLCNFCLTRIQRRARPQHWILVRSRVGGPASFLTFSDDARKQFCGKLRCDLSCKTSRAAHLLLLTLST